MSIQIQKNECNCNNTPLQLPCCHYLLTHKTGNIEIPIEYLRLKCNYVREKKKELTMSEGEITEVHMEEVNLNLNKAIEELNKVDTEEAQHFKNEIAYCTYQFLKYGYTYRKYRRAIWHEKVDRIKFSSLCTAHRKLWKKKSLSLRNLVVSDKKKGSKLRKKSANEKKPNKNIVRTTKNNI